MKLIIYWIKKKQAARSNVLQYVIFNFVGLLSPSYILGSYTFIRQNLKTEVPCNALSFSHYVFYITSFQSFKTRHKNLLHKSRNFLLSTEFIYGFFISLSE